MRSRTLSEYSVRIGMGTTETDLLSDTRRFFRASLVVLIVSISPLLCLLEQSIIFEGDMALKKILRVKMIDTSRSSSTRESTRGASGAWINKSMQSSIDASTHGHTDDCCFLSL